MKIKHSAWLNGLSNFKAINPERTITEYCDKEGVGKREIWKDDPVHPSTVAYREIATKPSR
jgi:hypothetical protein